MNFRNISSWCIRNPVFPIVLFVGLMLAGLIAFARMQVNNNPDIDFPAANVTVSQPGAAPNEIETQITQRIESAIRGVNGVSDGAHIIDRVIVVRQVLDGRDSGVGKARETVIEIEGSRFRYAVAECPVADGSKGLITDTRH